MRTDGGAQYEKTEFSSEFLGEHYCRVRHPSGLSVYVFPKRMSTSYALLATRYGAADNCFCFEGEKEFVRLPAGVAHFLEHKLFDNPDGSDAIMRLSALGADANAYTDYDRTAYLFSATDHVYEALAELIGFVTNPYFTEETVKKEQGIIAEEIRMYEDHPGDRCFRGMLTGLYENAELRENICGTEQSIAAITPEILYRAYHTFYRPSNMVLIVTGDVTEEGVMEVCDRVLPKTEPDRRRILREPAREPARAFRKRTEYRMQTGKTQFCLAMKDPVTGLSPGERFARTTAVSLLDDMLFSMAEPFYNRLFEAGLVSPLWSYGYNTYGTYAFNGISGEADDPDRVLEEWHRYLGEVRRDGLSPESFLRNQRASVAEFIKLFDSTEDIGEALLQSALDGVDLFRNMDAVESVTMEELNALLDTLFREEYETLSVVRPLE